MNLQNRAKVSPFRKVSDISEHEWMAIHEITRRIMRLSLAQGGASIRNYKDLNGQEGVFTLHVYRQPCDPQGREVISTETPDRRTTWWVPEVQK